jgi:hypothetical protein
MRAKTEEAKEVIQRTRGYVRRHRERMRYPQFSARGLQIGSGPVEAACKVITGQRLKGAGMRWSDAGAANVLAHGAWPKAANTKLSRTAPAPRSETYPALFMTLVLRTVLWSIGWV